VAVIGVAGCVAVVTLLIYFTVFSDQRFLAETLEFNAGRMNYRGIDAVAMARAVLSTAGKIVSGAGGPLLVGAFSALSMQRRHRSLLVILTAYAVASLGFNLVFFRLPGSGSYYLNSAIPALVVLAGASGGAVLELVQSHTRGYAVGIISATIQFAGTPPPLFVPPYVNPHRAAAQYIATHSAPYQGVLATTYAVQFYSGNPVRIIVDSTPALLLASLDGTTPDIISFVVIDHGSIPIGAGPIAADWQRLLQERFTLAPVDAPGLAVYVRK
jgi:hypothetical protein